MRNRKAGLLRRDCEPHRGPFLEALGAAAKVLGLCAACVFFLGLVGLALGVAVHVMAARDLRAMNAGLMDSGGRRQAQSARNWANHAFVVNLIGLALGAFW